MIMLVLSSRHATRVKNPGGQVVLGGDNVSPLVEIGLTDPPKSGGAAAPPASHLVACLHYILQVPFREEKSVQLFFALRIGSICLVLSV